MDPMGDVRPTEMVTLCCGGQGRTRGHVSQRGRKQPCDSTTRRGQLSEQGLLGTGRRGGRQVSRHKVRRERKTKKEKEKAIVREREITQYTKNTSLILFSLSVQGILSCQEIMPYRNTSHVSCQITLPPEGVCFIYICFINIIYIT